MFVLGAMVCLAANCSAGAEAATISNPPKHETHASGHLISSSAHHPVMRTAPSHRTAAHPYRREAVSHRTESTRTAHSETKRSTSYASAAHAERREPHHAAAYASRHTEPVRRRTYHRPVPVSAMSGYQRLARLHLQPERVEEIQQALIREGYLHGEASGQWDTRTHDAMVHFQTDHGFPATGLPEAKSLMKLGLGSHPLPPELDHGPAGAAASGAAQGDWAAPPSPPVSPTTPPS